MARKYRLTFPLRQANRFMAAGIRLGLAPGKSRLLTTVGRKTRAERTTPVSLVEHEGARWVVSPYGERPWVKNVRAADAKAWLTRGRRREEVRLVEADASTAAPVLKRYLANEPITRPYFDVPPDAPVEAFAREAAQHPVFRVEPKAAGMPPRANAA